MAESAHGVGASASSPGPRERRVARGRLRLAACRCLITGDGAAIGQTARVRAGAEPGAWSEQARRAGAGLRAGGCALGERLDRSRARAQAGGLGCGGRRVLRVGADAWAGRVRAEQIWRSGGWVVPKACWWMLGGLLWDAGPLAVVRGLPERTETGAEPGGCLWAGGGGGALPSSGAPHSGCSFTEETWGICLLTEKWGPGAADSELLLGID